jgi:hypothetical protein
MRIQISQSRCRLFITEILAVQFLGWIAEAFTFGGNNKTTIDGHSSAKGRAVSDPAFLLCDNGLWYDKAVVAL